MIDEELIPILDDEELLTNAKIKVIGVGGGGSNAINSMVEDRQDEVEYWVFNTDAAALAKSGCDNKFVLGRNVTKGLGAGGIPEVGRKAAEDSYGDIQKIVKGADLVFLAVGEGGGTGTGAAPIVAKAAKEEGCLVLGVVTRPFSMEGKKRGTNALEGISELRKYVDALIIVSNDKLMFTSGDCNVASAFKTADSVLKSAVETVTNTILDVGGINLDFADVRSVLQGKGLALIGVGEGSGEKRALDAVDQAINCPLLEASIRGSKSMIVNFVCGPEVPLNDLDYAIHCINQSATGKENSDCNIIMGSKIDMDLKDTMRISIIASDFDKDIDLQSTFSDTSRDDRNAYFKKRDEIDAEKFKPETDLSSMNKVESVSSSKRSILPDFLKKKKTVKEEDVEEPEIIEE